MPGKWKCTVCGYIHEGNEPPDFCPVCGSERSMFIPFEQTKSGFFQDMAATFILHPVAAHFPNGLIPTAALFLLLALGLDSAHLEHAAFYLLAVVLFIIPVSMASGIHDWQKRFHGERASIFYKKIGLASALFIFVLAAVGIRYQGSSLVTEAGIGKWVYVGLVLGMSPIVALLGHYGAKLAFQWKKKEP